MGNEEFRCYKNDLGKYENSETYFSCGSPVEYFHEELGVWIKGRVEHGKINGYTNRDYYFFNPNGTHLPLYDGVILKRIK